MSGLISVCSINTQTRTKIAIKIVLYCKQIQLSDDRLFGFVRKCANQANRFVDVGIHREMHISKKTDLRSSNALDN